MQIIVHIIFGVLYIGSFIIGMGFVGIMAVGIVHYIIWFWFFAPDTGAKRAGRLIREIKNDMKGMTKIEKEKYKKDIWKKAGVK